MGKQEEAAARARTITEDETKKKFYIEDGDMKYAQNKPLRSSRSSNAVLSPLGLT